MSPLRLCMRLGPALSLASKSGLQLQRQAIGPDIDCTLHFFLKFLPRRVLFRPNWNSAAEGTRRGDLEADFRGVTFYGSILERDFEKTDDKSLRAQEMPFLRLRFQPLSAITSFDSLLCPPSDQPARTQDGHSFRSHRLATDPIDGRAEIVIASSAGTTDRQLRQIRLAWACHPSSSTSARHHVANGHCRRRHPLLRSSSRAQESGRCELVNISRRVALNPIEVLSHYCEKPLLRNIDIHITFVPGPASCSLLCHFCFQVQQG